MQNTALRPIFSPPSPIGTFGEHMYQIQQLHMSNMQLERYSTPRPNFSSRMQFSEQYLNPHSTFSPSIQFHQGPSQPPLWRPQLTPAEVRPRQIIPSHIHIPRPFERPPSIQQTIPAYQNPLRIFTEHSYPWIRPVDCPKVVRPIPMYPRGLSPSTIVRPPSSCSSVDNLKSTEPQIPSPPLQQQIMAHKPPGIKEKTKTSAVSTLSPKQKKSSRIDEKTNAIFEKYFEQNKSPSQEEICEMCEKYNLTKGAVRTWFSARRQKQKRVEKVRAMRSSQSPKEQLKVPSDSYDITVEVPSINPRDRGSVVHQDYKDNN